jgi:hypothetical protein
MSDHERYACDALLEAAVAQGSEQPFDYSLHLPKWQFLCYIAEQHNLALHGSGNHEIDCFEPRQSSDFAEFGAQQAVYAAADGIWPMYFAIVDRSKSPSIVNACIYLEEENGALSKPYYFFSISKQAVDRQPYHAGVVYLLPSGSFMRQPPFQAGAFRVHVAQLASPEEVVPLAKLVIEPADFPFIAQMHTHDDERLALYAEAMSQGLPWPE